jgi:predicted ester cyclase
MQSEADNKLLASRLLEEVVNTGAVERLPEFLAPDYVAHNAGIRGLAAARQHIEIFRHCYPDLHVRVDGQMAEGDMVATWFTMRGTHRGQWRNLQATNRVITLTGVNIQKIRDGRIVEQWGAANTFEALLEIGAVRLDCPDEDQTRPAGQRTD